MLYASLLSLVLVAGAGPSPLSTAPEEIDAGLVPKVKFALPLLVDASQANQIERIDLYVSTDRGKKWKKVASAKPDDTRIPFTAGADGLYWFALMVILKDGTSQPKDVSGLTAAQKVIVDTNARPKFYVEGDPPREARKPPAPEDRTTALEREVAELKARVKELEKRLAEAEKIRRRDGP